MGGVWAAAVEQQECAAPRVLSRLWSSQATKFNRDRNLWTCCQSSSPCLPAAPHIPPGQLGALIPDRLPLHNQPSTPCTPVGWPTPAQDVSLLQTKPLPPAPLASLPIQVAGLLLKEYQDSFRGSPLAATWCGRGGVVGVEGVRKAGLFVANARVVCG